MASSTSRKNSQPDGPDWDIEATLSSSPGVFECIFAAGALSLMVGSPILFLFLFSCRRIEVCNSPVQEGCHNSPQLEPRGLSPPSCIHDWGGVHTKFWLPNPLATQQHTRLVDIGRQVGHPIQGSAPYATPILCCCSRSKQRLFHFHSQPFFSDKMLMLLM